MINLNSKGLKIKYKVSDNWNFKKPGKSFCRIVGVKRTSLLSMLVNCVGFIKFEFNHKSFMKNGYDERRSINLDNMLL